MLELRPAGFSFTWHAILLLPAGLIASAFLCKKAAPEIDGFGTEEVLSLVEKETRKERLRVVPARFFATLATISVGGSAGKTGPSVQMGALLCAFLGAGVEKGRLPKESMLFLGAAAGFSAVLGAPFTAVIFAKETLAKGHTLRIPLLGALTVASLSSALVASLCNVQYFYESLQFEIPWNGRLVLLSLVVGIASGLVSIFHVSLVNTLKRAGAAFPMPLFLRALLGSSFLLGLLLLSGGMVAGLGEKSLGSLFSGGDVSPFAWILKSAATGVTVAFGGNGGIVSPTLFVGVASGNVLAHWLSFDCSLCCALAMVAVFAGTINAPFTGLFLAVELFGVGITLPAALACFAAYWISRPWNLYARFHFLESRERLVGRECRMWTYLAELFQKPHDHRQKNK
ncbi:MAG: chloride channel protein [Synergistales bacterium]|nr:chloride channel protein [Synergistales bacterium]